MRTLKALSDKYQRMLFGDKSEKRGSGSKTASSVEVRRGHGPRRQEQLDVERIEVKLGKDEDLCPCCGKLLIEIKGVTEDSERVNVVERRFVVQKIERQKYRCDCRSAVVTAPAPTQLVVGGRYSVEFAVHVAVEKYLVHMTLDRQRRSMRRLGLDISTSTLWDQINKLAALHEASYDCASTSWVPMSSALMRLGGASSTRKRVSDGGSGA